MAMDPRQRLHILSNRDILARMCPAAQRLLAFHLLCGKPADIRIEHAWLLSDPFTGIPGELFVFPFPWPNHGDALKQPAQAMLLFGICAELSCALLQWLLSFADRPNHRTGKKFLRVPLMQTAYVLFHHRLGGRPASIALAWNAKEQHALRSQCEMDEAKQTQLAISEAKLLEQVKNHPAFDRLPARVAAFRSSDNVPAHLILWAMQQSEPSAFRFDGSAPMREECEKKSKKEWDKQLKLAARKLMWATTGPPRQSWVRLAPEVKAKFMETVRQVFALRRAEAALYFLACGLNGP